MNQHQFPMIDALIINNMEIDIIFNIHMKNMEGANISPSFCLLIYQWYDVKGELDEVISFAIDLARGK